METVTLFTVHISNWIVFTDLYMWDIFANRCVDMTNWCGHQHRYSVGRISFKLNIVVTADPLRSLAVLRTSRRRQAAADPPCHMPLARDCVLAAITSPCVGSTAQCCENRTNELSVVRTGRSKQRVCAREHLAEWISHALSGWAGRRHGLPRD